MAPSRPPFGWGFNLLHLFTWSGKDASPFAADELALVAGWGFDLLRVPIDYRHLWRDGQPIEAGWTALDGAVTLAALHGLHLNLNLHHAPGFCINTPSSMWSLWTDPTAEAATADIWQYAARRYRQAPARLSFDLINEPTGCDLATYEGFVRRMAARIWAIDPGRAIVADGHAVGTVPLSGLVDTDIVQSVHCYAPHWLTHYQASWVYPHGDPHVTPPQYPGIEPPLIGGGKTDFRPWDRQRLEEWFRPWTALRDAGVTVHCGEFGVFHHTPRAAQLAWYRDVLGLMAAAGIGWALWNLEGPFGLINSRPGDAEGERLPDGRALDRQLLTLLQRHRA